MFARKLQGRTGSAEAYCASSRANTLLLCRTHSQSSQNPYPRPLLLPATLQPHVRTLLRLIPMPEARSRSSATCSLLQRLCRLHRHRQKLRSSRRSDDPHKDVQLLLAKYKEEPKEEPQLKMLLPHIASTFGRDKSVSQTVAELKKLQSSNDSAVAEWASDALLGLGRGAPFSLCLTQKHFSQVASESGNDQRSLSTLNGVMKTEYRMALRSSIRNDFAEGVRAVLVDKDQKPKWNPPRLEDVDMKEVESLFDALAPEDELQVL